MKRVYGGVNIVMETSEDLDDTLIARYVERGDERAFNELIERHLSSVFLWAMRRLGNCETSEEVALNVFTILARKAGSLCPCRSRMSYADCCMPFHYGKA